MSSVIASIFPSLLSIHFHFKMRFRDSHVQCLCEMVIQFVERFTRNFNLKKPVNNEEIFKKINFNCLMSIRCIYVLYLEMKTAFYIIGCSGVSVARCAFWRNDFRVVSSKPAVGACKILVCFIFPLIMLIKNNNITRFGCVLWTFCKHLIEKKLFVINEKYSTSTVQRKNTKQKQC